MSKRIKPVDHDDELSVVEHLDELRTRLITVGVVFTAVLALTFWQNDRVLDIVNKPLPDGKVPATFGVSEAFMSTMTVSIYAALILTMPLILWHIYAFVIPAFSEQERKVATPLLVLTPFLFLSGVAFGYFFVMPAATGFLLNFNDDQFDIFVRASEYYSFFGLTTLAMGLLFEMPLAILIATRIGLVTPTQLRNNRRYALLVIAVAAMLLPGTDPVSMLIEMAPLIVLFEFSIWLAVWFGPKSKVGSSAADQGQQSRSAETGAAVR